MKTATKFLGGAAAGLALGVAASMFLASKKGQALRENITETAADFYKNISPQLKKIGKMSQHEYEEFMDVAAEKYGKAKKLSAQAIKELKVQAEKSWQHFAQNLE